MTTTTIKDGPKCGGTTRPVQRYKSTEVDYQCWNRMCGGGPMECRHAGCGEMAKAIAEGSGRSVWYRCPKGHKFVV